MLVTGGSFACMSTPKILCARNEITQSCKKKFKVKRQSKKCGVEYVEGNNVFDVVCTTQG